MQYAPKPTSPLGYHRLLSPTAAVRVSPICLGAMNFGDAWKGMVGECPKPTAFEILDYFFEQGGNFIDTSNNYQNEESELWLGEWMAQRQNRDQMVLATKFTTGYRTQTHGPNEKILANYQGNSTKSLVLSLEASLKKLKTDYIDILYVHWWDFTTSIPELMQSLNNLVTRGKVLYLGVSDTPAWIVSKANEYARHHGFRTFSVYQGRWSAAHRDFERDILPMAESEGMALAPWGALGGGAFKTKEQRQQSTEGRAQFHPPTANEEAVTAKLSEIATRLSTRLTSVALAYIMHKYPYAYPIVGGRTLDHIKSNIAALSLSLSDKDISEIEGAASFDVGFPMSFLFGELGQENTSYSSRYNANNVKFINWSNYIEVPEKVRPIQPHAREEFAAVQSTSK
ncbi:NADP-dependent oxidoreductase domain-containing protein [Phlyctochytrium arcticum]|nr:NADP-dependent oxidoreductase domain-containing protein [Phlyctochytrium arcticum]